MPQGQHRVQNLEPLGDVLAKPVGFKIGCLVGDRGDQVPGEHGDHDIQLALGLDGLALAQDTLDVLKAFRGELALESGQHLLRQFGGDQAFRLVLAAPRASRPRFSPGTLGLAWWSRGLRLFQLAVSPSPGARVHSAQSARTRHCENPPTFSAKQEVEMLHRWTKIDEDHVHHCHSVSTGVTELEVAVSTSEGPEACVESHHSSAVMGICSANRW